jgi:riboflavin kinase/FMN adenylyltransferase
MPFSKSLLVPAKGVYISRFRQDSQAWPAVTNIGCRPTVDEADTDVVAESHLFGFNGRISGRATVELLQFLRPEKQFVSLEKLCEQINSDAIKARVYHGL